MTCPESLNIQWGTGSHTGFYDFWFSVLLVLSALCCKTVYLTFRSPVDMLSEELGYLKV